jgi:hypothetical protein
MREHSGDKSRYRLLAVVREYAAERLAADPSHAATVHRGAAAALLGLLPAVEAPLPWPPRTVTQATRMRTELPNVRAALHQAAQRGENVWYVRLACA